LINPIKIFIFYGGINVQTNSIGPMSDSREVAFFVLGDFACSIWLTGMGTLCGYIGVPPSHPWYGVWYNDIQCDVHGGLTYSAWETHGLSSKVCIDGEERYPTKEEYANSRSPLDEGSIWNRMTFPKIDEPKEEPYPHDTGMDLYWIGFDCAHAMDIIPGIDGSLSRNGSTYKDEEYVRNEIAGMVSQAAEVYQFSKEVRSDKPG